MLVVAGMPGVFVVAGVLALFVVASMLVVTGVLSGAVRPVQVVRGVGRSVIGVAQFTNALLGDLGGVTPFGVVPGVLGSVVIVPHRSSLTSALLVTKWHSEPVPATMQQAGNI
jgi:hypothetical protein